MDEHSASISGEHQAAESGEGDNMASTPEAQPHQQPVPWRFPPEIWIQIIKSAELPRGSITTVGFPPGFLEARNRLYNLCLVAKLTDGLARPLLYRIVIFSLTSSDFNSSEPDANPPEGVKLIRLMRTLREKPALRNLVKHVVTSSSTSADYWWRPTAQLLTPAALISSWPFTNYGYPAWDNLPPRDQEIMRAADLSPEFFPRFGGLIFYRILLRALFWYMPDLECIHLAICIDAFALGSLLRDMQRIGSVLNETPLPNVKTLGMQRVDRSSDGRSYRTVNYAFDTRFPAPFEFTKIHLWAHTRWAVPSPLSLCTSLRELKLFGPNTASRIHHCVDGAPQLEILSIVVTAPMLLADAFQHPEDVTVNDAIQLRTDTLQELEVRVRSHIWWLVNFGPGRLLDCLPHMKKLRRLVTEASLVPEVVDRPAETSGWTIEHYLPPNLVDLALVELPLVNWGSYYLVHVDGIQSVYKDLIATEDGAWCLEWLDELKAALAVNAMPSLASVHLLRDRRDPPAIPLQVLQQLVAQFETDFPRVKFSFEFNDDEDMANDVIDLIGFDDEMTTTSEPGSAY